MLILRELNIEVILTSTLVPNWFRSLFLLAAAVLASLRVATEIREDLIREMYFSGLLKCPQQI